eukprot:TRINITY_DN9504_c0_g1_i3.p1 TRINITY_DN9504_c0_g1~~TRINITY_DN9504_c0_g1_i3.p1  ORF type:complete len:150 (+),score=0.01 TRINITY_DN9504_c0_g1_i3:73-522(+)
MCIRDSQNPKTPKPQNETRMCRRLSIVCCFMHTDVLATRICIPIFTISIQRHSLLPFHHYVRIPINDLFGGCQEHTLDADSALSTGLKEQQAILVCKLFALLKRHLSPTLQINLVAHEHFDDAFFAVFVQVLNPVAHIFEGLPVGYGVD